MNKKEAIKFIENEDEGLEFYILAQLPSNCFYCRKVGRNFFEVEIRKGWSELFCSSCNEDIKTLKWEVYVSERRRVMPRINFDEMDESQLRDEIGKIRADRRGVGRARKKRAAGKRVKKARESMTREEKWKRDGVEVEEI